MDDPGAIPAPSEEGPVPYTHYDRLTALDCSFLELESLNVEKIRLK